MLGAGKNTVEIIIAAKDRTQAAFAKVNTQMKTMKGGAGRLGGAMNTLKGGLSSATSSLGSFGAALGPVGIALAGVGVVMATLGGATVKASLEFEKAFATIRAGGATGEVLKGLNDDFRAIHGTIPSTAAEISGALEAMNSATCASGTALQDLTTNIMEASRMLGEDGTANAQTFGEAMKQWQIPAASGVELMEQFFKITQDTGIGFGELTGAMNAYGPVLQNAGFTAAQSAELFGRLEGSGIAVSRVMPGLNAAFRKWADAGIEGKGALEGTIVAIQNAKTNMEALTIATDTFGAEGAQRMTTAVRNGTFELSSLGEMLEGTEGIIMKTSEATLTFGDKWALLKSKVTEAIAPIGDVITNVLGNAIEGLSGIFDGLQNVIGPAFNLITIKFQVLKAFLEGLFTPIIAALAPLKETLDALQQKFAETSGSLSLLSDIFTIITGAAKWLGEAIGTLVAMALTPLVAKLKEGIDLLATFYEKLGPIKGALEWVSEGVHNVAESFRDTKPPIEEVATTLETLAKEGPEAPKAIADAWALATKSFQEGTGTYKEAIDGINEKIAKLTEEYMTATDKRKVAIEKEVELLRGEGDALEELKKTAEDALSGAAESTEKATEKMKEFKVTIGDTSVSFKGAAAEVVKNADAYEKLQDSAQKIMDLDWSIFTEFEASLPSIETGIQDMEGAFVGLKDILEDNIGSLEAVKESVMDISEIAAPFLEAGFLEGIESIGSFAGTLKAAGSAINDFSSLQDVSIDGCMNFSMHVRDMVSALELLESQMEDLVPSFGEMDSLITDIADSFLYGGDKADAFGSNFENMINNARGLAEEGGMAFTEFSEIVNEALSTEKIGHIERYWQVVDSSTTEAVRNSVASMREWTHKVGGVGITFQEFHDLMNMSSKEQAEWLEDFLHRESTITFQMDKQTNALKAQTGQLSKITEALHPYLEFMRTLNELAALSTLSTAELNSGLNSINDTLVNMGKSLETFDLRPVMETLFGTKIAAGEFTGGIATGFTDTMKDFATPFSNLIVYVERLSSSIFSLVSSFEALAKISDSVLADQTKLKEVFEGITTIMANFSTEMGGTEGVAQKFADGMEAMLESAAPLIKYFQDNNAAVELFNKSLSAFGDTAVNTIGVFEDLASVVERSSDLIVVSAEDIETALSLVDEQLKEIAEYLRSPAWSEIAIQLASVGKEWTKWAVDVDLYMPAFDSAVNTFSTLTSNILGLSSALKDMRDMSVLSVRDIDEALKNIPVFLDRFVKALALNMYEIKRALKELDIEWSLHTDEMKATIPAYEDSTDKINKLISPILSLNSALHQLAEMGTISSTTFDKGFTSLMSTISNFAVSLGRNVDGLISSLQTLRQVWIENEDVLYPLIYDFAIISDNLFGVAHNANRMAEEFKNISDNSGTLEKGFESLIEFIGTVVALTKEFYTTEAAAELATYIADVGKVVDAFVGLERELKTAMGKVKSAIEGAVDTVAGRISSLGTLTTVMYNSGANIMQSLINGIWSKTFDLATAVGYQAMIIQAYLGASSNTERGPLSNLENWGGNIIRTVTEGINREMPTLNAAFGSMSSSMGAGTARGRGGNITLYNTQYINSREDGDYATRSLERMLQRHEVM